MHLNIVANVCKKILEATINFQKIVISLRRILFVINPGFQFGQNSKNLIV